MLLMIPFVYITGTLLYMGSDISIPEFPPFPGRYRPGSVYRSDQVFDHLWPAMQRADVASDGVRSLTLFQLNLTIRELVGWLRSSQMRCCICLCSTMRRLYS